jgi:hypothetical protein
MGIVGQLGQAHGESLLQMRMLINYSAHVHASAATLRDTGVWLITMNSFRQTQEHP